MASDQANTDTQRSGGDERWTLGAVFTIGCLGVAAGVQMSDFGLQALSLSAIQRSFGVGDAALGALQGLAGVLVGSFIAIPLARFADRFSRKRVLLAFILASAAMMVLSALAPNFALFFLGRSAAGITEFAMIPLVYSMIPDLAPEKHRVAANLSFAALMATGTSCGFYFAGPLITTADSLISLPLEPWRKAFLLLSAAEAPLFLLALLSVDPPRRIVASGVRATLSLVQFLRSRWQAVGLFVGVAGCLLVAVQALNQLITLGLERRFAADVEGLGQVMGLIILATTIGCLPVAWMLDRLLSPRLGPAARPLIMGLCGVLAVPCVIMLAAASHIDQALTALTGFLFATCTANALVPTMLQDLTPAELRARSFAVWSFVVSIFSATGPMIAGTLSAGPMHRNMLLAIAVTAIPALVVSSACAIRSFIRTRHEAPVGASQVEVS